MFQNRWLIVAFAIFLLFAAGSALAQSEMVQESGPTDSADQRIARLEAKLEAIEYEIILVIGRLKKLLLFFTSSFLRE